jgi:hypothetical protein
MDYGVTVTVLLSIVTAVRLVPLIVTIILSP